MQRRTILTLVLCLCLALGLPPRAVGQAAPAAGDARELPVAPVAASPGDGDVELVGQIGGAAYAVTVQGPYAYAGIGPALVILDVTQPLTPTLAGRMLLPEPAAAIEALEGYAYLADRGAGLRVVDVSSPAGPREVGACAIPGEARDVAVAGGYAWVAAGSAGLRVIDVSDSGNPHEVGACATTGEDRGVWVLGQHAYVAAGVAGLRIVDISQPASPHEVGSFRREDRGWGGEAYDVAVRTLETGTRAYIAYGKEGVVVVDVSDPGQPRELGDRGGSTYVSLSLRGDYAYAAAAGGGFCILDIRGYYPETTACFWGLGGSVGICTAPAGGPAGPLYVYVADQAAGLCILDVSAPGQRPTLVSTYTSPAVATSVHVLGRYAYVAAGSRWVSSSQALATLDIADPAHPQLRSVCPLTGRLAVAGGRAYLAEGGTLRILSLQDPARPVEIGGFSGGVCQLTDVAVSGHYAFMVDQINGLLRVVDVTDPAQTRQVGVYEGLGDGRAICIVGSRAYVAVGRGAWAPTGTGGLRVFDIANPQRPRLLGACDTPSDALGVWARGSYAYVADKDGGLRVIDVADPSEPHEVGACDTPGQAQAVHVVGTGGPAGRLYAFLAAGDAGMQVIDVSDPAHPAQAGGYDTAGVASDVFVAGSLAYVADAGGGLAILRFPPYRGGPAVYLPAALR